MAIMLSCVRPHQAPQALEDSVGRSGGCRGLVPEVEKAGLLPELGFCEAGGAAAVQGRQPADVYLPHWGLHGPAAFDLAVTSGLRGGALTACAVDGSKACAAYGTQAHPPANGRPVRGAGHSVRAPRR